MSYTWLLRYQDIVATPLVPFAIGHLKCIAGVMVTASHNPKEDNGYKVGGALYMPRCLRSLTLTLHNAPSLRSITKTAPKSSRPMTLALPRASRPTWRPGELGIISQLLSF